MTGASIVRWESADATVLALHGAFDGASAWTLRHSIEESPSRDFVVDLTHVEEACDFAACLLATWTRQWRREKRVVFRPGTADHARLLARWGLEIDGEDEDRPTPSWGEVVRRSGGRRAMPTFTGEEVPPCPADWS